MESLRRTGLRVGIGSSYLFCGHLMESGLPGPLEIKVSYSIQNDGASKSRYQQRVKPTFCNPVMVIGV